MLAPERLHTLDADRAFAVLVRYRRDDDIRLREVAESLVTRPLPGGVDPAP